MFGDITRVGANFHAMESLANLKKVNGSIGQVQSRLSSGKRINSAEDDTSGYALSKHLQSRVNGLSQALDNVSTAKNVLNIAEGGYQSQMNILQQIKENLTQAADGALSSEQRGAIGDRIESLLTEFNEINDQTKYNGFVLFNDSDADRRMTFQVGEESIDRFDVDFHNSKRASAGEDRIDIDAILDNGDLIDSITYNGSSMEPQTTALVSDASATNVNYSGYANSDTIEVVNVLTNQPLDATNYDVDADGNITFTGNGIAAGDYTITYTETLSGNSNTATSTISLSANGTENTVLSEWSELDQTASNHGISVLDEAIKSVAKTIQKVGDYQARLSSKEESLSLGISNTEATRSRIEDADFAKEQMSMMKLQILQQTSVSAFTQSNSAPQVVLSLFR
ncbi:MAG: flagellin [Candidatus Neomarinimicrobiota bacterium]|nr:flagellin [Candidatus Neomarinimicrobiota bacterium]